VKPTPLLDLWQKPAAAGEPVALLATTFALEPDFFEQNCLARFLEVSSVSEDTGSVDDIVAAIELHESLQKATVTVLADRSAPVQRSSLLWDLLSCKVEGGLLHAKVSLLLWERATRIILGSANLTAAGYRRQIELGLAVDLGPGCLFPSEVLAALADELDGYLDLVPGFDMSAAAMKRAIATLGLFRARIEQQRGGPTAVRVAFAPTNPGTGPFDSFPQVWRGARPLHATHLSPYWDSSDPSVLVATRRLLTGRPADKRSHRVAVVLGPRGQVAFPSCLADEIDSVRQLKELDAETRTLHAKCLLIESDEWVAALVGSSNHTKAGMGLDKAVRHREMNVWIGAELASKEGRALVDLIQLGGAVPVDAEVTESKDEDEAELPALPGCFGLCQIMRRSQDGPWELHLGIARTRDMPPDWQVALAAGSAPFTTRAQWTEEGSPEKIVVALPPQTMPMYVLVTWQGIMAPWAVLADDHHALPVGPALSSLRAQHLLDALATERPLAKVLRDDLERQQAATAAKGVIVLDPLKRLEVEGSLLRKGRALAVSLAAMQRRLERPVVTLDTLRGRLASPLGPEFVATKVAEAWEAGLQSRAEALFTIVEIALTVGRVDWPRVLGQVDRVQGTQMVVQALSRLDALRVRVGSESPDLASYASRAIKEAHRCVAC
jgi:hypothetical protein